VENDVEHVVWPDQDELICLVAHHVDTHPLEQHGQQDVVKRHNATNWLICL
jgi:hypothetical protein